MKVAERDEPTMVGVEMGPARRAMRWY